MSDVSKSDNFSNASKENIIRIIGEHCVDIYGNRYADTQCPSYMHRVAANKTSGTIKRNEARKAMGLE